MKPAMRNYRFTCVSKNLKVTYKDYLLQDDEVALGFASYMKQEGNFDNVMVHEVRYIGQVTKEGIKKC